MIEVLDRIPVTLEADGVMKWLRMQGREESIERMVRELIETTRAVARPKAVYAVSRVDNRGQDALDIDGIRFTSRILRINLDKANRVFPYVATCGQEMEDIPLPDDDLLRAYCLDLIKTLVLVGAVAHLASYLTHRYQLGKMSHMNPGSLESWPITEQTELFSVLGDVDDTIGVTLTEALTMVPLKSASGIYFPNETEFENCQLCPMEKCIGRRAPYDPDLVKQYEETNLLDP
jgi:hypothetical protein